VFIDFKGRKGGMSREVERGIERHRKGEVERERGGERGR